MKKTYGITLSILTILGLVSCTAGTSPSSLASAQGSSTSYSTSTTESQAKKSTQKNVTAYLNKLENTTTVNLRFYDDEQQIPYIEMEDAFHLRKELFDTGTTYETANKSSYSVTHEGSKYTVKLNNRGTATFDIENQTFTIPNLGLLQAYSYNDTVNDILCMDASSSSIHYVTHQKKKDGSVRSYSYLGSDMTISLAEYEIPVYEENDKAYIPLDLFNNFFLSYTYNNFIYNGDAIFTMSSLIKQGEDYKAEYFKGSNHDKKRSQELADFAYNSLMLNLNYQYGLKSRHRFGDFRTEFETQGWTSLLKSTDEQEYIKGLYSVIYNAFGDGHCYYGTRGTYASKEDQNAVTLSFSDYNMGYVDLYSALNKSVSLRQTAVEANPNYGKCYYEDGDTAYVRFDSFNTLSTVPDYYKTTITGEENDIFAVISYANSRIKANSSIKNVVVDLATNTGGEEPALIFALGWMLGDDARVSLMNPNTHCSSTIYYNADVNLDGQYNVLDDTLEGYNKFILTTDSSFSCGNALPVFAKDSEKVKIIGETSGGGCSQVFPLITTDGTILGISGGGVLCHEKNSHYSDIDDGATPDFTITEKSKIFDREYTTKVVHSLVL